MEDRRAMEDNHEKRTTPEEIKRLAPNEIFVFGSNTQGIHGRGAALTAKMRFGAEQYVGEGLTGRCYAFPTMDVAPTARFKLVQRSEGGLLYSVALFYDCVLQNPDTVFLLTKVGCGLAGFGEEFMKRYFKTDAQNLVKPEGW